MAKLIIRTIMLIDDDTISNLVNEEYIRQIAPSVAQYSFSDPAPALQQLQQPGIPQPDLILLDINMPQMNGWEFLDGLQRAGIGIPVIMLTSSVDQRDRSKSREYPNVYEFWSKPIKIEHLQTLFP